MPCVLDTGSQVTLFSQSFFQRHFGCEKLRGAEDLQWLTLNAANGLRIPFVGYAVLDFNVRGIDVLGRAALIVEDQCISSDNGFLGMNVIAGCWEGITQEGALGKIAFKSRVPPKAWGAWEKAFTVCQQVHQTAPEETPCGMARLRRQAPVVLPPEAEVVVWADAPTYLEHAGLPVLVEDIAKPTGEDRGWCVARVVSTVKNGKVPVRLCNPHSSPVLIPQRHDLATVSLITKRDIRTGNQVVLRDRTPEVLEVDVRAVGEPTAVEHPALELEGEGL